MKVFICLLVLAASANAGVLHGGVPGYAYGGGLEHVHVQQPSIIKLIHEHPHHALAPSAIVKVIHEDVPSIGLPLQQHQLIEAAPQVVQVGAFAAPAPVVHHVKVIHEHAAVGDIGGVVHAGGLLSGDGLIHGHGVSQDVKIIKVIQEDHGHHYHESHGWA